MKNEYLCEDHNKCLCGLALNEIPLYVFWKDKDLIFRGCNENFAKFLGFNNSSEIVGKTDYDLVDKKSADHFREIDKMLIKDKKPICNTEPTIDSKHNQVWMNVNKVPLLNNGEVIGILGTFEDVTEKKDLEGKLDKSEEKYKSLIEFTNTSYVIMNKKLKILETNNNFMNLMETDNEKDIVGRNLRSWVCSQNISLFDTAFNCLLKGKKIINNLEISFVNENGNRIYISANANLIKNGATKIFCLISDISHRKMLQQAEYIQEQKQKERIKQNILELKNKLQSLKR